MDLSVNELKVNPSLEFGLAGPQNEPSLLNRRRSSVQEAIISLSHEIQRVPDLVVTQTKKVQDTYAMKLPKI